MRTEVRLRTAVLPGHRIELTLPELIDGETVEVVVRRDEAQPAKQAATSNGILDFLQSLPAGPRSYPTWEEFEQGFQKERDAWER